MPVVPEEVPGGYGPLSVQSEEVREGDWAEKVRGLLGGSKLLARMKEAEELERAAEKLRLAEADEDKVPEEDLAPAFFRVSTSAGSGRLAVSALARSTGALSGELNAGDVVTVVKKKGDWLRLAPWEAVTGWVKPAPEALVPATDVPEELMHLRTRAARTEVLSWCLVSNLKLPAPLPGGDLGGVKAASLHSRRWGLEARTESFGGPLLPPGRPWRVYAARDFVEGETVEVCELVLSKEGCNPSSVLWSKALCPSQGSRQAAVPMGFGSLYRRTTHGSNVEPLLEMQATGRPRLVLRARQDVKLGEELTTSGDFLGALGGLPRTGGVGAPPPPQGFPLPSPSGAASSSKLLDVRESGVHGRGVFATESYARGDVIELCPALVLDTPSVVPMADYAMRFDRQQAAVAPPAKPVSALPWQGDWDPLADPSPVEDGPLPSQAEALPGAVEAPSVQTGADDWDPFAEPAPDAAPTARADKEAPGKPGKPSPASEAPDAAWSDPFADPAGRQAPARPSRPAVVRPDAAIAAAAARPQQPQVPLTLPEDGKYEFDKDAIEVLPLGCGALYNHKERREGRNVRWSLDSARGLVVMMATRDVRPGEELFISYGAEYWEGRQGAGSQYQC